MNNKKITIPFNFEISSNYINDNISETTNINVSNDNFIITQNGALDINMMLEFEVLVTESKRLSLIKDINIEVTFCQLLISGFEIVSKALLKEDIPIVKEETP